ncbi:MAG: PKD domain-containing protein, partial [Planctomycetota bacterium]
MDLKRIANQVVVSVASALLVSAAQADFVGIEIESFPASETPGLTASISVDATVYRIVAVADSSTTRILNVGTAAITSTSPFYQVPGVGTDVSPWSGYFHNYPPLPADTFVTHGNSGPAENVWADTDSTAVDPDFVMGTDFINGGWFNGDPSNGLGDAGTYMGYRVPLAQITVLNQFSEFPLSGEITVFWQDPAGGEVFGTVVPIVEPNSPPIPNAGPDRAVSVNAWTQIWGSAVDPDGDEIVGWQWTVHSAPDGSTALFSDPARPDPEFNGDLEGAYVLSLTASDGTDWSYPNHVVITLVAARTIARDLTDEHNPPGTKSFGLYIKLDLPNVPEAQLLMVTAADILTDDPAGFYQYPSGTDLAPQLSDIDLSPGLAHDSYISIGLQTVPEPGVDDTSVTPDWNWTSGGFNTGGPLTGTWFAPSTGQGVPDQDGEVFIGQFTVGENYNVSGQLVAYIQGFGTHCGYPDWNNDGAINLLDMLHVIASWGPCPSPCDDCNDDHITDERDLVYTLAWYPWDGSSVAAVELSFSADTDNDRLMDWEEFDGACPYYDDPDSDGDGVLDGDEVAAGTDPCVHADQIAPTADAGESFPIAAGDWVFLDGSGSHDDLTASENLIYDWTLEAVPPHSVAMLIPGSHPWEVSFVADLPGTYAVRLIVTDEAGKPSLPDTLQLTASQYPGGGGQAGTIYVDDDHCPGPGSGTEADPYCSIQVAIYSAAAGAEIVVEPGTYLEAINLIGKAITLRSSDGPEVTIIDAQAFGSVVTCVSGEGPDTVLDGFTITNGDASLGGGLYNELGSPTVINCTIADNTAFKGGGLYSIDGSVTVTRCNFIGNVANFGGGAMLDGAGISSVTACTFRDNLAYFGGGMFNEDSYVAVTNSTFSGNTADYNGGGIVG